jgi:hypothetical protein
MDAADSNGRSTDPIRSWVCERCWNGLFAFDSFQAAWCATTLSNGSSYTTTWSEVDTSAGRGCRWCRILQQNRDCSSDTGGFRVTVGFSRRNEHGCTPKDLEKLRIAINHVPKAVFYVYTGGGEYYQNSGLIFFLLFFFFFFFFDRTTSLRCLT